MSSPSGERGDSKKKIKVSNPEEERMDVDPQASGEAGVRGRGGFRSTELRTIPSNITVTKAANVPSARRVDLLANYVPIVPMANRVIHMYRIDYEPKVESASLMRFLFSRAHRQLFDRQPIFDGAHECRSSQKLRDQVMQIVVEDAEDANRSYTVTLTHTGTSSYGPEVLRIYNMHMKRFLGLMGYYSPQPGLFVHRSHGSPVSQDIMMLRGFRTSANQHDGNKMLMNLEGAHKLVQTKNVLLYMSELRNQANQRRANMMEYVRQELVGKLVVASYNYRVYRIEDVEFDKNPTHTFDRNGTPTSFVEFYRSVHQKDVGDTNQPLLKVVPNNQRRGREEERTKEILLLPEFCNIAGLTTAQRNDNRLRMDLIRASQIPPQDRVRQMRDFLASFHQNTEIKQQLSAWGYNYGPDPVELKAQVVPPTGYLMEARRKGENLQSWTKARSDSADMMIKSLATAPPLSKMAIIVMRNQQREKTRILDALKSGFDSVGLRVAQAPQVMDIDRGDSARDYIEAIRSVPRDFELAIVVLANQNKERYDAVKKAASVERGLITQVVTAKLMTEERKARSAAQKIAIQIAAKVGGEPWWVDIPMKKAMVCGYDTYHDTTKRGRSYGAFVASLNNSYSRWWSKADAHDRLEEVSAQMSFNMTEAVNQYKKFNNGELPDRVIMYRDGVGEGQLEHVFRVELKKLKEALGPIALAFIVVNKRIGARFYMREQENKFSNPPPGTVIDHTVTRQERYDFYLISQSTRQGTVTPTYYNIIHDESNFPPEIHQKLAFKLCSLYYNWSGTVRVPAPCQYAHKLALLCGEHLHAQPNSIMDDKLHYL